MAGFRKRFFAPSPTSRTHNMDISNTPPSAGASPRFSGLKRSDLVLLLACAAAIFLLFSPRPALTSSEAIQLAKTSRNLSDEMSNEEFIAAWKEAAQGRGGPKWDAEPFSGSGYLVSCLYKAPAGDLRGWFFEIFARERVARRITRSLGDSYSHRMNDIFFRYSLELTEDKMVASWMQEVRIPSRKQTVLEKITGELRKTEIREKYGWITEPLRGGKWLEGFVYESTGDPEGKKRWVFQIDAARKDFSSCFSPWFFEENQKEDLIPFVRETGSVNSFFSSASLEEQKLPFENFLGAVFKKYGESAEEAKKRFGPPRTTRRKNMTSIHDESYKYVVTTLTWPGLTLDFFQAPDKETLVSVTARDEAYPFGPEPGIRVGMPFSAVVKILGEPEVRKGRSATYMDDAGFYDLVFHLERSGAIEEMKFLVYMD